MRTVFKGRLQTTSFDDLDPVRNAKIRRPTIKMYSMASVVELEHLLDSTTAYFFDRLDELFAERGAPFDFGKWIGFYTFDVIGELTFSERLGFLDRGEDVDNMITGIAKHLRYATTAGQMPWVRLPNPMTYHIPIPYLIRSIEFCGSIR